MSTMERDPDPAASRDALHNLADALGEDVIAAPPERLAAEVAEDHGDGHAFAAAFDRISARAARQSSARRIAGRVRALASSLVGPPSWKPVMAATAALAVLVVAGDLYWHVRPGGVLDTSAPATREASLVRDTPAARPAMTPAGQQSADSGTSPPASRVAPRAGVAPEPPAVGSEGAPAGGAPAPAAAQPFAANRARAAKLAPENQKALQPRAAVMAAAPPAAEPLADQRAAKDPSFGWPLRGRVVAGFGSLSRGAPNKGIDLAVPPGTDVVAADDGIVVHVGRSRHDGSLVLVRHRHGFVTAYGHADKPMVKPGDHVRRGQVIAKSGRGGGGGEPQLHFEIRKGATPLDPAQYLPPG
jgi:murein DD-endopeptidase MepM/ murein hydrolase activator NlpD